MTTPADRKGRDQGEIDDEIAAYLADAGVPPPPRTVRWSLLRPGDLNDEDFWTPLHSSMDQRCPQARHPSGIHNCVPLSW